MSGLFIDGISAPDAIKDQLKALSLDIKFTRESTKGANGYLFFGENRILRKQVAVKFYYWGGDTRFHAEPNTLANIAAPNILSVNGAGFLDGRP